MKSLRVIAIGLPVALGIAAPAGASCGSAFCVTNTNWDAHGAWAPPGLRVDLRYEAVAQKQLLSGSRKVAAGEIPEEHDEVRTGNRNLIAALDYAFNADWGLSVALPMARRDHQHLENDDATGTQTPEAWKFNRLGDARVLGRYRLATTAGGDRDLGTLGLNFGVKLPTGSTGVRNGEGERAERSLQPGTGTTDALVGLYYARLLPLRDLSWFAQGLAQLPLNQSDGYRPGARLALDAGLRYELAERVSLLLQANVLVRGRDSGANAERANSGGRAWFLSPGISVALTDKLRAYAFLQAPLYQHVNGVQLGTRPAAVIGASANF